MLNDILMSVYFSKEMFLKKNIINNNNNPIKDHETKRGINI